MNTYSFILLLILCSTALVLAVYALLQLIRKKDLAFMKVLLYKVSGREQKYRSYLKKHIKNTIDVWKDVLRPAVASDLDQDLLSEVDALIASHDESKYDDLEWQGYLDNFYPADEPSLTKEEVEIQFKYAWLHHQHLNEHHWQYWVLMEDDNPGKPEPLDMPIQHVLCMLADWASFRYGERLNTKYDGEFNSTREWYDANKEKQIMTDNTRELVEKYIDLLP